MALFHIRLLAQGNVQGVGYRNFACRTGTYLGLVGFAKNLPDHTVEIVAEGEKEKIDDFCRRMDVSHPFGIKVSKLEIVEQNEIKSLSFASFSISF